MGNCTSKFRLRRWKSGFKKCVFDTCLISPFRRPKSCRSNTAYMYRVQQSFYSWQKLLQNDLLDFNNSISKLKDALCLGCAFAVDENRVRTLLKGGNWQAIRELDEPIDRSHRTINRHLRSTLFNFKKKLLAWWARKPIENQFFIARHESFGRKWVNKSVVRRDKIVASWNT